MNIMDLSAGVILAILVHGAATVWWGSKMTTTMSFVREDLKSIASRIGDQDKEIRALWRKVDELTGNNHKEVIHG